MGNKNGVLKIAAKKIGIDLDEYLKRIDLEKWCSSCKSWQLRSNFSLDKSRGDGLGAKCFNCTRKQNPYESLKGRVSTFKGKTHSESSKDILREKSKKRIMSENYIAPMLGKNHTLETKKKISVVLREKSKKGSESHSFKDGKTQERRDIRFSKEYKRWRFDVFFRDKFICQKCLDSTGGNLNAHHIKPFSLFPELRFDVDNGLTLCESCHKNEHKKK